jgi:SNF family Na+-dependent transporter
VLSFNIDGILISKLLAENSLFMIRTVNDFSLLSIDKNQLTHVLREKIYKSACAFFPTGLGYCSLLTTMFVAIYYMVIIAWVLFYMWASFFPSLIWGSCDQNWNTISKFYYLNFWF